MADWRSGLFYLGIYLLGFFGACRGAYGLGRKGFDVVGIALVWPFFFVSALGEFAVTYTVVSAASLSEAVYKQEKPSSTP